MYILVLESSTTSSKALLYNIETGNKELKVRAYPKSVILGTAGTYDPEAIFNESIMLGRELCINKDISAVVLCCTWHSLLLCDSKATPQSPVYKWNYSGASEVCGKLRMDEQFTKYYYNLTGCVLSTIYPFFKMLHLGKHDMIMDQGSFATYRLTDEWVVSDVTASGSGMMDVRTKKYSPELLEMLGIDEHNLGAVVPHDYALKLSPSGASLLGLSAGIPVYPAIADGALNQLGSDAMGEGVMTFSAGTSGALRINSPVPLLSKDCSTWCYASTDGWLAGAATAGCCNLLDWFVSKFGVGYDVAEEGFRPKQSQLVFLPFLFGERCPGWRDYVRGGFFNMSSEHDTYDMYHAIQEGILFNLYQCYKKLTALSGSEPRTIKISGGILSSQRWLQMATDIFGTPMEASDFSHASLVGGVTVCLKKISLNTDLQNPRIVYPNKALSSYYEERYGIFLNYYDKL